MSLSYPNMLRIIAYLKSTEAFGVMATEDIAKHLDKLIRIGQFDAAETQDGKLIHACAWWMLTDRILEHVKSLRPPKRVDRGRNAVGLFMINDLLSPPSMLGVMRRILENCGAKTLSIYTPRKKWVSVTVRRGFKGGSVNKDSQEPKALQILKVAS